MDLQLQDKVAVITGAGGAIGGATARMLGEEGAKVAVWDISADAAAARVGELRADGITALAVRCDVTARKDVDDALAATLAAFGTVDILVNGAGGSRKETTTAPDLPFFELDHGAMQAVIDLNYFSAILPSQAVGAQLASKGEGCIVNIGSIAGGQPLTRAITYSNAKAAVASFTQWLAVHLAQEYSPRIRVNAVAPGFLLTEQNRFLLVGENGDLTERGQAIMDQVPMRRFGTPGEIAALVTWMVSPRASFMTGAVVPIDGGFTAFSGV